MKSFIPKTQKYCHIRRLGVSALLVNRGGRHAAADLLGLRAVHAYLYRRMPA